MTAVEWLIEQLIPEDQHEGIMDIIEDAKEREKQQIIDAYASAVMKENNSDYIGMHEQSSGEIYFNETYGSKESDNSPKIENKDSFGVTSSQTEISDGEIQSTAETFWTEPSESDIKRGWKLGAKWYREQLKSGASQEK